MKRKPSYFGEHCAARIFQARIIIGVQIVETDDTVPFFEQPSRYMKPDEAGGSGNQNWLVAWQSIRKNAFNKHVPQCLRKFGQRPCCTELLRSNTERTP